MKKTTQLISPFYFSLVIGVILTLTSMWNIHTVDFVQLLISSALGALLGLIVFFAEKYIYLRQRHKPETIYYETTYLWKSISSIMVIMAVINQKNMFGDLLLFSCGVYFLTLTCVLLRLKSLNITIVI